MRGVADSIADCIRFAIPQPTEWESVGNEVNAAMIFARADFVNVCRIRRCHCGRIWNWRLLLRELATELLLAFAQIGFVTRGIDERVHIAMEQAFVLFHEIEKAPVRRQKNVAGQMVQ